MNRNLSRRQVNRLEELREAGVLKASAVASALDVDPSLLSHMLKGDRPAPRERGLMVVRVPEAGTSLDSELLDVHDTASELRRASPAEDRALRRKLVEETLQAAATPAEAK
jgi:DNA-binding transcriptional regulator YdaS (Cro superfamily)